MTKRDNEERIAAARSKEWERMSAEERAKRLDCEEFSGVTLVDAEERQPVTSERLAEWEALEKAATKGPWEFGGEDLCDGPAFFLNRQEGLEVASAEIRALSDDNFADCEAYLKISDDDTDFIVAARNAFPDLLAEVRRSWEVLAAEKDGREGLEAWTQNLLARENKLSKARELFVDEMAEVAELREALAESNAENAILLAAEAEACLSTPAKVDAAAREVFALFGDKAAMLDLDPSEVRAAIAEAFGVETKSEASE